MHGGDRPNLRDVIYGRPLICNRCSKLLLVLEFLNKTNKIFLDSLTTKHFVFPTTFALTVKHKSLHK